jgi:transposase
MIRIEQIWLATEPMDMRAGPDTALARVVKQFGEARAHHAYVFTNKRANRLKVLVHDGFGLWLAARRLHQGKFIRAKDWHAKQVQLDHEQLKALVLGLSWSQAGKENSISIL